MKISLELWEMIAAGILFGAWPLLMNRSGLNSVSASLVFTTTILILILPTTFMQGVSIVEHKWWFGVAAGICSGLGLLIFNNSLTKISEATIGKMFIIMLVVQTSVPAIYHVMYNHQLSVKTFFGFSSALLAIFLLC